MKKSILLLACISLLLAGGNSVFAEDKNKDVMGKYIEGTRTDVIVVDIAFGEMNFEFKDADKVWDKDEHKFKDAANSTGTWTVINSSNKITIKSDSSKDVDVQFSFVPTSENTNLNGSFAHNGTTVSSITLTKPGENQPATSSVVTFMPTGKIDSSIVNSSKIGVITLTIN